MSLPTIQLLDIPFLKTTRRSFIQLIQRHIQSKEKAFVVTANPEIVVQAQEDPVYKSYIQKATYVIADGIGIIQASRLAKRPLPERVSGFDVMSDLIRLSIKENYTVYLLGARESILARTVNQLELHYPGIQIIGSHHGYFTKDENNKIIEEIQFKKPDLVFVALGCPLQEAWIAQHFGSFNEGIFMGVGGGFDVLAGVVKRAPDRWIQMNLEWFYRFIHQPTRWRRMFFIPKFGYMILKRKLLKSL